jgi:bifunctional UDP-N-acetylglucosamine pyrophosphorylase/glucosamine-1-phosphate N-acetyltransferase
MMTMKRQKITALILAAGKGTRMGAGNKPKVLYNLAGKPMLQHILDTLWGLSLGSYAVVLDDSWAQFLPLLEQYKDIRVCHQKKRNGTGGAVAACASLFKGVPGISYAEGDLVRGETITDQESLLVCYGDTPLLASSLLQSFIDYHENSSSDLTVLGMDHPRPTGYGRLLLGADKSELLRIVEEKDATEEERGIHICNSGIILAKTDLLFELLRLIKNNNSQNEYYLTDVISLAEGRSSVRAYITKNWEILTGVNTQEQLKEAEKIFTSRLLV